MTRKLVSKAELAETLTARIRAHPRGRRWSISPDEIFRLHVPIRDGRNWIIGLVAEQCRSVILNVLSTAQHEFNLADEQRSHPGIGAENRDPARQPRI
jgi:hypothetical protein